MSAQTDISLRGLGVLVTRPAAQAAALMKSLQAAGATPYFFPVIDIEPLTDQSALRALTDRLGNFHYAFFVSANAVVQALTVIPRAHWPVNLQTVTVGPGSARVLHDAGFANVMLPTEQFDSEGVLALPAFAREHIAGKRVLILRGEGGRELFAEGLRARDAEVHSIACYRRVPARVDGREGTLTPLQVTELLGADELNALTFTSSEGVRNFVAMFDAAGLSAHDVLASLPSFAPHPRIVAQLHALGAAKACLTAVGDAGVLTGLREYFVRGGAA